MQRQFPASIHRLDDDLAFAGVPENFRSVAAVRWALATLSSRTMFLEGDTAGVLMPFGDLHNHSPSAGAQLPDLGAWLPCFCSPGSS